MLLIPRVNQRAFLQLPLVSQAPSLQPFPAGPQIKTSALELRLLPVTPAASVQRGPESCCLLSSPCQPVPSVQYLEEFPEENGAHFGVLLAWQEKGIVTARSLPRRPDLFSIPQGSGVRRESE